ncbi:MAG: HTTM domain-containing protein [Flavobacteriales bacterium]|nr:HTTM domain-containing protein [Flavobacteriales bacterium]
MGINSLQNYLSDTFKFFTSQTSIAPLVTFRIIFGLMMFLGTLRFWCNGWIDTLYVKPIHFFNYYGFEWVKPLSELGMYMVFLLLLVASLGIALGLFYRFASLLYFLLFTYVELIDITNYLNHYYFISLIAFLLCILPANRSFSIDASRNPSIQLQTIPKIYILILKFQIGVVYFFAGIAKINYDWLFQAMPMSIWLQAKAHWPLIGNLFTEKWFAYSASWMACVFDLLVVFCLLSKRFRAPAYFVLVVFHVITGIMFPIGMFPWIMILATLLFFPPEFHQNLINLIQSKLKPKKVPQVILNSLFLHGIKKKLLLSFFLLYACFQILFPFRYLYYPEKLFWTEQGYRFSWRVMLMEKAGSATFFVTDSSTGKRGEVDNSQFLTPTQEKMMATQPDLILQYAHIIRQEVESRGLINPIINAEVYVTLNGSKSRLYIDPEVNLVELKDGWQPKNWILDF